MSLDLAAMEAASTRLIGASFLHRGRDPAKGLDCTGLVILVYRAGGFDFPDHVGALQAAADEPVDALAVLGRYASVLESVEPPGRPGDLLVTSFYSDTSDHIAIILGGGYAVHAVQRMGVVRSRLSRFSGKVLAVLRPRL